jgi:uncharacterized Zn finger protein
MLAIVVMMVTGPWLEVVAATTRQIRVRKVIEISSSHSSTWDVYNLDESETPKTSDEYEINTALTCVTSRHGDKAGNGKSDHPTHDIYSL